MDARASRGHERGDVRERAEVASIMGDAEDIPPNNDDDDATSSTISDSSFNGYFALAELEKEDWGDLYAGYK